jgi:hypothetical protein
MFILKNLMSRTSNNQTEAARLMGINRLMLRKTLGIAGEVLWALQAGWKASRLPTSSRS